MNVCINVLVIDDDISFTTQLSNYFDDNNLINIKKIINKGANIIDVLLNEYNDYDLIILNINILGFDAIKFVEIIETFKISCKLLILSNNEYNLISKYMLNRNRNYFIIKPINMSDLEKKIIQLYIDDNNLYNEITNDLMNSISEILHLLGVPSHLNGYSYLRECIYILYTSNDISISLTKEIYPDVATKFNTTPQKVERSIRNAIEVAWDRGDIESINKIFSNSLAVYKDRPTNSEFISTVTDRLKLNNKGYFL